MNDSSVSLTCNPDFEVDGCPIVSLEVFKHNKSVLIPILSFCDSLIWFFRILISSCRSLRVTCVGLSNLFNMSFKLLISFINGGLTNSNVIFCPKILDVIPLSFTVKGKFE